MPASTTSPPRSWAARRAAATQASSSSSIAKSEPAVKARGVRLASMLKVASSVVKNLGSSFASTSAAMPAGRQLLSTKKNSCSAPIRWTPVSIIPASIIRSRACTSSKRARVKSRSPPWFKAPTFCSPMVQPALLPSPGTFLETCLRCPPGPRGSTSILPTHLAHGYADRGPAQACLEVGRARHGGRELQLHRQGLRLDVLGEFLDGCGHLGCDPRA